jgi:hypothetical protein
MYMTCIDEQIESIPQVDFTGPWFVACYVSLPLLTVLMLIWCAWNQRWSPIPGSELPLESIGTNRSTHGALKRMNASDVSAAPEQLTQTGYKTTIVGSGLYYLIVLAHVVIQFLLFALTVEYCEFPMR